MSQIQAIIKRDSLAIALFILTISIMTFPLILHLGDSIPMDNGDTHTAMWQNWWILESLENNYNVNQSPILFYPQGLNVSLQPRRWTSFLVWMPLYRLFGDPFAFNMTALIQILIKAYGMYLFMLWLTKNRIAAWISGAFYACAAGSLLPALQQPNTGSIEWIPYFMYAFVYILEKIRTTSSLSSASTRKILLLFIVAGLAFSASIYTNIKIGIFAMLLGGSYVLLVMILDGLWRRGIFWLSMLCFALVAIFVSAPVLVQSIQAPNIDSAIDATYLDAQNLDIVSYIRPELKQAINYTQLIASLKGTTLATSRLAHVGIVSLACLAMGILYAIRVNRRVLIWLLLAIIFWAFSLGVQIEFRGEPLNIYWTPYRFVAENIIFRILHHPFRQTIIFLFPFSVLIGYGIHYRTRHLSFNRKTWLMLGLFTIMLFYGTSLFPIPIRPASPPDYVSSLDQQEGGVVDLPFGRSSAKYYMSIQRYHQHPIAEGMIARMPPNAYDYIKDNPILGTIYINRQSKSATLRELALIDWKAGIQSLIDDGFSYLVIHKHIPLTLAYTRSADEWLLELFDYVPASYEDDEVRVYLFKDLLDPPQFTP